MIERVETFPMLYPLKKAYGDANGYKNYRSCYLIRVVTKSGIEGWGECVDWLPTLEKGFHERIIPYLIGKNAIDRLAIVHTIKKWHQRAAAAVSMALTEITAKHAGLSICELWGGARRNRVPVYASFQSYSEGEDWVRHSLSLVDKAIGSGFTQLKVKVGGRTFAEDQAHIASMQRLLNGKVRLAIDANQSYDAATARRWVPFLAEYDNLAWFEEPIPLNRVTDYAMLRAALPIPIAGGENLLSAAKFLPLLIQAALDIAQPDVLHEDGMDGYRDTLLMSRAFGVRVSPHAYDGTLARLYALFAQACLPPWSKMDGDSIEPVEWDVMDNPFTALLPLDLVNGECMIPAGIGLGVELNRELLAKYRWDGRSYAGE